jgi:hypothetical protein
MFFFNLLTYLAISRPAIKRLDQMRHAVHRAGRAHRGVRASRYMMHEPTSLCVVPI